MEGSLVLEAFRLIAQHEHHRLALEEDLENRPTLRQRVFVGEDYVWRKTRREPKFFLPLLPLTGNRTVVWLMPRPSSADHDHPAEAVQELTSGTYGPYLYHELCSVWPGATQRMWWLSPCVARKTEEGDVIPPPSDLQEEMEEWSVRHVLDELRPRLLVCMGRSPLRCVLQRCKSQGWSCKPVREVEPCPIWRLSRKMEECLVLGAPHPYPVFMLDEQEEAWGEVMRQIKARAPLRTEDAPRELRHARKQLSAQEQAHRQTLKKRKRQRDQRSKLERELERDDDGYDPDKDNAEQLQLRREQRKQVTSPLQKFLVRYKP